MNAIHASSEDGDSNAVGGPTGGSSARTGEWRKVDSPTSKALYGAATTTEGPFAVGADGRVLTRRDGEWRFAIRFGPATRQNTLTCVAATDDGDRIWFAGSSGALGCYDVDRGRKVDHSAPNEKTSTWEAIAVRGERGSETLRVANGSGELLAVGMDDDGCPRWGDVVKPGSGSTVPALDFGERRAYAVDTSGNAFEERDGGWEDVGVKNAQVNFYDAYADGRRFLVAGGGGRIYRYDRICENWTPVKVGEGALHSIDGSEDSLVVAGASGHVYERTAGEGWTRSPTPVEVDLRSIATGETDVAVGADGTILER